MVGRGGLGQWVYKLSFKYLDAAWLTDCPSPASKLVLVSLADHANDNGGCFPSVARIAKRCKLSRRGVQGQLRVLEKAGLISTKPKTGTSNSYHLHLRTVCAPPANAVRTPSARPAPKPSVITVNEPKGKISPTERISLEKERDELREERRRIRSNCAQDATGTRFYSSHEESRLSYISNRLPKLEQVLRIPL